MDNDKLNRFKTCKNFTLHRVSNGWLIQGGLSTLVDTRDNLDWVLVFENTKSMAEQLPGLLGESGWRLTVDPPVRDKKGHFVRPTKP